MKLKAVFDSIIMKEIEEDESQYGNIVIPDMGKEKHIVAEILDVGPGKISFFDGKLIPTRMSIGDKVILPQVGIVKISHEGEEYIACDESKVLAIIKD